MPHLLRVDGGERGGGGPAQQLEHELLDVVFGGRTLHYPAEARTLNGLLTPQRPFVPGGQARIKLPRLDAHRRDSRFAISLEDALVEIDGPLGNRRAQRAATAAAGDSAWARVLRHPQSGRPELGAWLEHARRRYGAGSPERTAVILRALHVLSVLPPTVSRSPPSPPPTREMTRARSDRNRPLGRLVAAASFALEHAPPREPASADEWRALWAGVGGSCDELSCTALTLGLRPHRLARGYLAGRLRAATRAGKPLVLTLADLAR